jgi:hypothetical protein
MCCHLPHKLHLCVHVSICPFARHSPFAWHCKAQNIWAACMITHLVPATTYMWQHKQARKIVSRSCSSAPCACTWPSKLAWSLMDDDIKRSDALAYFMCRARPHNLDHTLALLGFEYNLHLPLFGSTHTHTQSGRVLAPCLYVCCRTGISNECVHSTATMLPAQYTCKGLIVYTPRLISGVSVGLDAQPPGLQF